MCLDHLLSVVGRPLGVPDTFSQAGEVKSNIICTGDAEAMVNKGADALET